MRQTDIDPSLATWEAAYARFETPLQERAKFRKRLRQLDALKLDRSSRILEIFCGRGNGMNAWADLGFNNVEGLDLSPRLLAQYGGPFKTHEADACKLPFNDNTFDILCVQGGLHHLPSTSHLAQSLDEARRVLKPTGRFLIIEPWETPFLRFVHSLTRTPLRRLWPKLDALAVMIHNERTTYEAWLAAGPAILNMIEERFTFEKRTIAAGKLMAVTRPKV
ncbi:MAG: class I SAM-dependent methyltransferase [Phycisphaeraceae bacterium]